MMLWSKCEHPAEHLAVEKSETLKQSDQDFDVVTYHLVCLACDKKIKLKYATTRGGVAKFLTK